MYICFSCEDDQKIQLLKSRFESLGVQPEIRENTYVEYEGMTNKDVAFSLYQQWQSNQLPGCYLQSYDLD